MQALRTTDRAVLFRSLLQSAFISQCLPFILANSLTLTEFITIVRDLDRRSHFAVVSLRADVEGEFRNNCSDIGSRQSSRVGGVVLERAHVELSAPELYATTVSSCVLDNSDTSSIDTRGKYQSTHMDRLGDNRSVDDGSCAPIYFFLHNFEDLKCIDERREVTPAPLSAHILEDNG